MKAPRANALVHRPDTSPKVSMLLGNVCVLEQIFRPLAYIYTYQIDEVTSVSWKKKEWMTLEILNIMDDRRKHSNGDSAESK